MTLKLGVGCCVILPKTNVYKTLMCQMRCHMAGRSIEWSVGRNEGGGG